MNALHDNDDGAGARVVEARKRRAAKPFICVVALGIRQRVARLKRIVDYDKITAASRQSAADRCCETSAPSGEFDFTFSVLVATDLRSGESLLIKRVLNDKAVIIRMLCCEVTRIAVANKFFRRIKSVDVSGKDYRGHNGLERTRRHFNNEPLYFTSIDTHELVKDS